MTDYDTLRAALDPLGLLLRGGFHPTAADGLDGVSTVVVVGNAGPAMWSGFIAGRRDEADPLDAWVRRVLTPIAAAHGARLVMPSDGPPYLPFQRWAMRADAVRPSPLGLLIHPAFGLWHAYRAALLFATCIELPPRSDRPSPCAACADAPCLTACPVGAFTGDGYDAAACRAHVSGPDGAPCRTGGCLARHACPVGRVHAYGPDQQAFHMAAFLG